MYMRIYIHANITIRLGWRAGHCCEFVWTTSLWPCYPSQHTALLSNTLQRTATFCNTMQHTSASAYGLVCGSACNSLQLTAIHSNTLQHTATHCNTTPNTAASAYGRRVCDPAILCNTLQHTATHCTHCCKF